jgi:hypothetical protein
MNRPFGVPASAGPDRLKAGHQTSGVPQRGLWSQCMRKNERRLSLHEPAVPERGSMTSMTRRTWGCSDALRLTEPRSHRVVRFMVPGERKLEKDENDRKYHRIERS